MANSIFESPLINILKKGMVMNSPVDQNLIQIDRGITSSIFVACASAGWLIVEQDERAFALTEVDLRKILFETMLHSGETSIRGEEKLRRLKDAGHIRLDVKVFETLWENQSLIPESWKSKGFIFFPGTVFRNLGGARCVLCLCWIDGRWGWGRSWLDDVLFAENPSACLASLPVMPAHAGQAG